MYSNFKNKSRNNNSFIYSWNMATSVSNLGNGIVFENLVSDEVEYQEISLPEKRKKNYLIHIYLFGINYQFQLQIRYFLN